ncbi:glycogen synthase GlgA [Tissierella creatinini]|nr:glycogen synthase GlgA [Tissierella creatinini]TJX64534.1 glycogen synthase GlgA [Soehngenia saccharolytica]
MKILFAASEVVPFMKTGGLADVAGSLPLAINKAGHDIRVVMPLYSGIKDEYKKSMTKLMDFNVDLGWRRQYAGILTLESDGVTHYFIDNEFYFNRYNIYSELDDGERFIFYQKALVMMLKKLDFKADIVHANDWHTGLVPLYIKDFAKGDDFYKEMKSVYTIHNLKYQGIFPGGILEDLAGLSRDYLTEDGVKFYDAVNFMKAGIVYSDTLTTVSKTYAEEIKSGYYGEGLNGIIRDHEYKLYGIVNGIDYDTYNPDTDPYIEENYNINKIHYKAHNKEALQKLYGLPVDKDIPLIGMVTRMVKMKGLDLVRHIFEELIQNDIQFILLGTGDKEYEDSFNYFQSKYPDKVRARIYFNEKESHLIYAGADMFLMPSLAEPCGISQLISLRYGTLPVVRETGGLKDTVIPYNESTGEGNGFTFKNFNAHDMLFTLKSALKLYDDEDEWLQIITNAMKSKNDWEKSSDEYLSIYKRLKLQWE